MSHDQFENPVEDTVPKIDGEVAVGEDLDFQRRWWKFESAMWWFATVFLLMNFSGIFGKGPLAHAKTSNEAIVVKYERVERTGTPSILSVAFQPGTPVGRQVRLRVSQSVVEQLGAQRVIPSPSDTSVGAGGLTYTFTSEGAPGEVEFALQPAKPGIFRFSLQVPGSPEISRRVVVMP